MALKNIQPFPCNYYISDCNQRSQTNDKIEITTTQEISIPINSINFLNNQQNNDGNAVEDNINNEKERISTDAEKNSSGDQ